MCTTLSSSQLGNHQGRSAGTRDQGLGWGGAGEPGGCGCHPREGLTPPPTPCWSHQVTAAAVRGSRDRRRCTCLQHTSLSSTSVVIKGRALVKYGTQGARLLHTMQAALHPLGVIRGQGPPEGPPEKVPVHLLWSESLVVSELIFSDSFFSNPLVSSSCFKSCPHPLACRPGWLCIYLIVLSLYLARLREEAIKAEVSWTSCQ